jgi:hypothetical protein
MLSLSDTPTPNRKDPEMIKKTLAAIALAGALVVMAPQAGFASETPVRRPTPGAVTTTDRDTAVTQAFTDIEQRLAADPTLARQFQRATSVGDSAGAAKLLAAGGADVTAVGSSDTQQVDVVRLQVTVTVCVRVWGTVYCRTVTLTVDL